jgi:hypothetical protein
MARAYDVVGLKTSLAQVVEGYVPDMTTMGIMTLGQPDAPSVPGNTAVSMPSTTRWYCCARAFDGLG